MTNFFVTRSLRGVALLCSLPFCAQSAPCFTAGPDCTEWINLHGSSRSLVYRTYPLETKNESITRALVMVHGAGRDADNYFRTALAASFLAGALDNTIVVAPRFASNDGRGCKDSLGTNEVNWSCNGDSWRSGGTSISDKALTSYDFADEILRKLARKDVFPNLKIIVLAGRLAVSTRPVQLWPKAQHGSPGDKHSLSTHPIITMPLTN